MFAWERLLWVRVTELVRSIRSLRVGADKTQLTTAASALRELKVKAFIFFSFQTSGFESEKILSLFCLYHVS
jgi:hypothetical protein